MPLQFTEDAIRRLPPPIVAKLQSLIARIRRVLWLRGLFFTVAAAGAALLAVMAVDAAFDIESTLVRALLSASGLAAVAWVAWRHLVRPLRRTVSLAAVARLVEIRHPEMQERISTAVELLASDDPASYRGSEELLAEVVKSAVVDVDQVNPEAEFSSAPAVWPKRLALAAAAVLVLVLVIWPRHGSTLLARALLPFANIGSASSFELRVITKNVTVAAGEPVTILVAAKGKAARRVDLVRQTGGAEPATERLMPEVSAQVQPDETAFALHIPAAQESFTYHVTAGRARSEKFAITVLQRPEFDALQVTYTYPAYTGLAPKTDPDSAGDLMALVGTRVDVVGRLTRPATSATIVYDQTENQGPPATVGMDGTTPVVRWSAVLEPTTNYRWRMQIKGEQEIDGRPREGLLRSIADEPPAVVIDSPVDRELTLKPNDTLPVIYTAADDFGLAAVDLQLQLEGRGQTLVSAPLPDRDPTEAQLWHGTAKLDLSRLPLAGVNSIRLRVRVSDTLPADMTGPQTGVSDEVVIRLNWGAQSFAEQTVAKQEKQLRKEIDKLKNDLWDQRAKAEQKMWQLRERDDMKADQLQQLEQLTQRAAQTANQMKELADKMEKSAFAERAAALEKAAESMVQPASEDLQRIPQTDSRQERSQAAEAARDKLETAAKSLDSVLENLWQDQQQAQQVAKLDSLARQQQQLADQAREASPNQPPQTPATPENTPPNAQDTASTQPATQPPATSPENTAQQAQQQAQHQAQQQAQNSQQPQASAQPPPTPEEQAKAFEKWQQQQEQVQRDTQNFANQLENNNPQGRQDQLQALAEKAQSLAAQAEALAQQQDAVEQTTQSAQSQPTPAQTARAAQQQADISAKSAELAQQLQQLREQSRQELGQNGPALQNTQTAAQALEAAAETGQEATRELSRAASQQSQPQSANNPPAGAENQPAKSESGENQSGENQSGENQPGESQSGENQPGENQSGEKQSGENQASPAQSGETPASGAEMPSGSEPSGQPKNAPTEQNGQISSSTPSGSEPAGAEGQPTPATAEGAPEGTPASDAAAAGNGEPASAVAQTSQSLDAAAAALKEAAQALSAQASGLADEAKALANASSQTKQAAQAGQQAREAGQQAGQQAADQARQAGQNPQQAAQQAANAATAQSLGQNAAEPAQQAANNLALAAAHAAAAAQVSPEALQSQNMGQHGKPTQSQGQPSPNQNMANNPDQQSQQPGEASDKQSLQSTKGYELPPELAKLGITADDWARLRGLVQSNSDAADGDKIPAEYRDLVKGYFRALATGQK